MSDTHYTNHVEIDLAAYWAAQSEAERSLAVKPVKQKPLKKRVWNGHSEEKLKQILELHPNTLRNAAEIAGVNQDTVRRVWKENGFSPTPGLMGRPAKG